MKAINGICYDKNEPYIEPKLMEAYSKLPEIAKKALYDIAKDDINFGAILLGYFRNHLISPESFIIPRFESRVLFCQTPSNLSQILHKVYGDTISQDIKDLYQGFDIMVKKGRGLLDDEFEAIVNKMPCSTTDNMDISKTMVLINNCAYSVCYVLQGEFEALFFSTSGMVFEPKTVSFKRNFSKVKAKGEVKDANGNVKHG